MQDSTAQLLFFMMASVGIGVWHANKEAQGRIDAQALLQIIVAAPLCGLIAVIPDMVIGVNLRFMTAAAIPPTLLVLLYGLVLIGDAFLTQRRKQPDNGQAPFIHMMDREGTVGRGAFIGRIAIIHIVALVGAAAFITMWQITVAAEGPLPTSDPLALRHAAMAAMTIGAGLVFADTLNARRLRDAGHDPRRSYIILAAGIAAIVLLMLGKAPGTGLALYMLSIGASFTLGALRTRRSA